MDSVASGASTHTVSPVGNGVYLISTRLTYVHVPISSLVHVVLCSPAYLSHVFSRYWCPAASVSNKAHLCRAGYYGDAAGQTSDTCSSPCPAGFFCPAGTATVGSTPSAACVDIASYCPLKSAAGLPVPAGYKALFDVNGRATDITPCDLGTWCVNGLQQQCPAGSYGASQGLQTASCSGTCSPGYFCPAGSKTAVEEECGSAAVRNGEDPTMYFCPVGSESPRKVQAGFYTACSDGSTKLCTPNRRVKELPCGSGFICANGHQRRAVEWDASLCTCTTDSTTGVDSCVPTDPSNTAGDILLDEQPEHTIPPWGTAAYLTWGRSVKATWFDTAGKEGSVNAFEIKNLRRYDLSVAAKAKTCTLLSSGTGPGGASLPRFALDGGSTAGTAALSKKEDQRVQYLLDFEDCLGWAFDLVATSNTTEVGTPKATSTCVFKIRVNNLNDRPFWGEAITGGDRYGRPTGGVAPSATARRSIPERSAANTAVGSALNAVDSDEGQEVRFKVVGGDGGTAFRINSCSGQLSVAPDAALDYNVQNM